jgi:hypothetical protein
VRATEGDKRVRASRGGKEGGGVCRTGRAGLDFGGGRNGGARAKGAAPQRIRRLHHLRCVTSGTTQFNEVDRTIKVCVRKINLGQCL